MLEIEQLKPKDFNGSLDDLWALLKTLIIQHWGWTGVLGVLVIALAFALWWNWKDIKEKPFVSIWIEMVKSAFSSMPKPIPGHFNVAIARLKNDQDDETRTELATGLQNFATRFNELGTQKIRSVEVSPVPLKISLGSETGHAGIQKGTFRPAIFSRSMVMTYSFGAWSGKRKNPCPVCTGPRWLTRMHITIWTHRPMMKNFPRLRLAISPWFCAR